VDDLFPRKVREIAGSENDRSLIIGQALRAKV
jgi:hypothetical protein